MMLPRWIQLQLLRAWWRYTLLRSITRLAVRSFKKDWERRDALLHLQLGYGKVEGVLHVRRKEVPKPKKKKRSKWRS